MWPTDDSYSMRLRHSSHYSVHRSSIVPIPFHLRPSVHRPRPLERKASQANNNHTTTPPHLHGPWNSDARDLKIKEWDIGKFGLRQRQRLAANEHGSPSILSPDLWPHEVDLQWWTTGRRTKRLEFKSSPDNGSLGHLPFAKYPTVFVPFWANTCLHRKFAQNP